jgi:hypothetical protein
MYDVRIKYYKDKNTPGNTLSETYIDQMKEYKRRFTERLRELHTTHRRGALNTVLRALDNICALRLDTSKKPNQLFQGFVPNQRNISSSNVSRWIQIVDECLKEPARPLKFNEKSRLMTHLN